MDSIRRPIARTLLWFPGEENWREDNKKDPIFRMTEEALSQLNPPGLRFYNPALGIDDGVRMTDRMNRDSGRFTGVLVHHVAAIQLPDMRGREFPLFEDEEEVISYVKARQDLVQYVIVALYAHTSNEILGELARFRGQLSDEGCRNVTIVTCADDWTDFVERYFRSHPHVAVGAFA